MFELETESRRTEAATLLTDVRFGRQVKDHINVFRAEDVVYQLPVAHISLSRDAFNGIVMVAGKTGTIQALLL